MGRFMWLRRATLLACLLAGPPNAFGGAAAPVDEAQRAGRDETTLPQASEDFFHDMDNGVRLSSDEVKGRNMWLV